MALGNEARFFFSIAFERAAVSKEIGFLRHLMLSDFTFAVVDTLMLHSYSSYSTHEPKIPAVTITGSRKKLTLAPILD